MPVAVAGIRHGLKIAALKFGSRHCNEEMLEVFLNRRDVYVLIITESKKTCSKLSLAASEDFALTNYIS